MSASVLLSFQSSAPAQQEINNRKTTQRIKTPQHMKERTGTAGRLKLLLPAYRIRHGDIARGITMATLRQTRDRPRYSLAWPTHTYGARGRMAEEEIKAQLWCQWASPHAQSKQQIIRA